MVINEETMLASRASGATIAVNALQDSAQTLSLEDNSAAIP